VREKKKKQRKKEMKKSDEILPLIVEMF